jgi:hypothetical protein
MTKAKNKPRLAGKRRTVKASGPKVELFRPQERLIFKFWDGTSERRVDPLQVCNDLTVQSGGTFEQDLKIAQLEMPADGKAAVAVAEANGRLTQLVQKVFGIAPYHYDSATGKETGLTNPECLAILFALSAWLDDVKKKWVDSKTSAPDSSAGPSPTPNTSASGSTGAGPSTDSAPPSPAASPSSSIPPAARNFSAP